MVGAHDEREKELSVAQAPALQHSSRLTLRVRKKKHERVWGKHKNSSCALRGRGRGQ